MRIVPFSKRSRRLWRSVSGFTIPEVAAATFVMALGIATSIIAMQAGFKQMDLARGTTIAAQILQSELERLRMMSWSSIGTLQGSAQNGVEFDGATNFTTNTALVGKYWVTRTITNNVNLEIKDIKLSVRWNTYDGRSHTRTFTAIYAKNGLYDYYYTLAHP